MSTVRLLLDEDACAHGLLRALRLRRFDVLTALEAGLTGHSDIEVLAFAEQDCRTLYSYNIADFFELHTQWIAQGREHSGIILASQRFSIGTQVQRLSRLSIVRTAEEMRSRLEFLSAW